MLAFLHSHLFSSYLYIAIRLNFGVPRDYFFFFIRMFVFGRSLIHHLNSAMHVRRVLRVCACNVKWSV